MGQLLRTGVVFIIQSSIDRAGLWDSCLELVLYLLSTEQGWFVRQLLRAGVIFIIHGQGWFVGQLLRAGVTFIIHRQCWSMIK